ncbi:MAG: hypothetical protein H6978_09735 [Gammaproteobacteria bacterium]|nr:hypothetical protein [Gammaproteobacteria bacterium]
MTLEADAVVSPPVAPRFRVAFLFNHEGMHQLAHTAPVAGWLARESDIEVTLITSSAALADRCREVIGPNGAALRTTVLPESIMQRFLAGALDKVMPFSRLANLVRFRAMLATFDAIVVPERTSLFLKRLLGERCPKLVHIKHGSGDRAQGFQPQIGMFDFLLLSGRKMVDRLLAQGTIREGQYAIIGYPKFDLIKARQRLPLFDNDRPVVVYNPHPDAYLSSYFRFGHAVLEYFRANPAYNLIFAPHLMLYKRRVHISLPHWRVRLRPDFLEEFRSVDNIHIDTGSPRSSDMSYTLSADIYLGDVSSQVYEFLSWPRPCVFLNAHGARWQSDPNYLVWQTGPVVSDIAGLGAALSLSINEHATRYQPIQQRLFDDTMSLTDQPSGQRAAAALREYLERVRS